MTDKVSTLPHFLLSIVNNSYNSVRTWHCKSENCKPGCFHLGNKGSDAVRIEVLSNSPGDPILLEDFIHKYLSEELPEALPYAKEVESELVNTLKTLKMPEKKPVPPASNTYPFKKLRKRDLGSQLSKSEENVLEDYIRNFLMIHDPSAMPYADQIQNDVLALLREMKRSAMGSAGSNYERTMKKRNWVQETEPKKMKLEDFLRMALSKEYPQYLPELKEIKNEVIQHLKALKTRHPDIY